VCFGVWMGGVLGEIGRGICQKNIYHKFFHGGGEKMKKKRVNNWLFLLRLSL